MIKIVIFSGGTGSIALQTGLHNLLGDSAKVDVIISAYDNGKSTGECRKVFNGKILGPSDLRKNQITQYSILNGLNNQTQESDKTLIYNLFEERFTKPHWESAYDYVKCRIETTFKAIEDLGAMSSLYQRKKEILMALLDYFFFLPYAGLNRKVRPTIPTTAFTDFSISNLFYSAAAAINGDSLGLAGMLMSEILGIPNRVHLISDVNLYLYAETKSGAVISDEGVIVAWNHPEDPIVNISLLDEKGKRYVPSIDENNPMDESCKNLIEEADIIIYSSGTQWSSLIPTYAHSGLKEVLKNSRAKKYLVMNNVPDKDMTGVDATKLLDTVSKYIELTDTKIVLNTNAESSMAKLSEESHYIILESELSEKGSKKHTPDKLASTIMEDYYFEYLNAKYYYFDFDDTIWSSSKSSEMREVSEDNIRLMYEGFSDNCLIISGNSSNHFDALADKFGTSQDKTCNKDATINIYCNGGNCKYTMKNGIFTYKGRLCYEFDLNEDYYLLSEAILKKLNSSGWSLSLSNFENRGNCILSIKPLKEREKAKIIIEGVVKELFGGESPKYTPYINGNTTIDIMNTNYNKQMCSQYVTNELHLKNSDVVYVGDRTEVGNDACLLDMGFKILAVRDVVEFNSFARIFLKCKKG